MRNALIDAGNTQLSLPQDALPQADAAGARVDSSARAIRTLSDSQESDISREEGGKFVGQVIDGRYRLLRPIGRGGMGIVFEADHLALKRRVSVKLLHPHLAQDEQKCRRFQREARSLARIHSPFVVAPVDVGVFAGVPFLVTEYLEGWDLRKVLDSCNKLPVERAMRIVRDAMLGVCAMHSAGLIHRDLKPENLFVVHSTDGWERCKLLDFGVVRAANATTLTNEGAVIGTAGYMSPEQVNGRRVDVRSDVFAFGAILYECLTGEAAFRAGRDEVTFARILSGNYRRLAEFKDVPTGLALLVDKALSSEPLERPSSVQEFLAALGPWLPSDSQCLVRSAPSTKLTAGKPLWINTSVAALVGALAVALAPHARDWAKVRSPDSSAVVQQTALPGALAPNAPREVDATRDETPRADPKPTELQTEQRPASLPALASPMPPNAAKVPNKTAGTKALRDNAVRPGLRPDGKKTAPYVNNSNSAFYPNPY